MVNGGWIIFGLEEVKPPNKKQNATRKHMVVDAIYTAKAELEAHLKDKIRLHLRWVGKESQAEVQITFPRVVSASAQGRQPTDSPGQPDEDLFLIQMQVPYYHGLCFDRVEGPEFYVGNWEMGAELVMLREDVYEWLETYHKNAKSIFTYDSHPHLVQQDAADGVF
jgi:hypothetical protein